VVTVEREEDLFKRAREVLTLQGYTNIDFILGDGTLGFPEKAPFDRIIVTAGAPKVPGSLLAQLKDEGKMILPVGDMYMQRLVLIKKNSGAFLSEDICGCVFVPLKGSQGWKD
jgi:protein-L-isoaspartate(D-aspartate) O-methyltransferase